MSGAFILRFQQPTIQTKDCAVTSQGTRTFTEAREGTDQDKATNYSCSSYGTMTKTATREEPDQDKSTSQFSIIPQE